MATNEDDLVRLLIAERRTIISYTRSIVFDQELAEDIYQNVAVVVLRKKDQVTESFDASQPNSLLRWVLRVARLEALTALRKRKSTPFVLSHEVIDALDKSWQEEIDQRRAAETEVHELLRQCVRQLTKRGQRILQIRYGKGLSGEALAAELGSELNTAYVALSRIHKQLRTCVGGRQSALRERT